MRSAAGVYLERAAAGVSPPVYTAQAMCRLFGFKSAVASRAHRSLIEASNALVEQARNNPDGWGIGYFHEGEAFVLKSQGGAADNDGFRRASARLTSNTLVAHVRRATVGGVGPFNVHPFRHGKWVFAHNGTLRGFERFGPRMAERIGPALRERVLGSTDTELLFFYLLSHLESSGVASCGSGVRSAAAVADALQEGLATLYHDSRDDAPPIVNFILTNGEVFVANRSGRELFLATQKFSCHDFEHCRAEKVCMAPTRADGRVNHLIVASERIGTEDRWEEVPEGTLLALDHTFRLQMRGPPPGWRQAEPPPTAPALQ